MVLSTDIPLKASEEAIVNFLLKVVFTQRKLATHSSRRECLQHDVYGACKLISWIVRRDTTNPRSLTIACNLVYGNTIVLSHQVTRLLLDAIRAREVVAFTSYLAEEEERRRRTREQMEKGLDDDTTTPKKKRRSKAAENVDDYLLVPSSPISIALRQDITMPDAMAFHRDENILFDDDFAPPTAEQYEALYGMLNSEIVDGNTNLDLTFVDRFSSNSNRREDVLNETFDFQRPRMNDFEFDRPSTEFVRDQQATPAKNNYTFPQEEELFEPHNGLADILRYGRLPFLEEGEQRRSMEDEMDDARLRGIHTELETPMRLEVPRLASEIELDANLVIPPRFLVTARAPRTPRRLIPTQFDTSSDLIPENKNRIPHKEMNNMMENYSSLIHDHPSAVRVKPKKGMPLRDLMSTVPYFLRKHCNEDLFEMFPTKGSKHDKTIGTNVSKSENTEKEDEDEEESRLAAQNLNFGHLEPINLSDLKFMETPLKDKTPVMSPMRPNYEFDDMQIEQARREDLPLQSPISPIRNPDDIIYDDPFDYARSMGTVQTGSNSDDKTPPTIRANLLSECEKESPYAYKLDSMLEIGKTSRREAARSFYVALELLKEHVIKVIQITPYGPIDIFLTGHDSDDLEKLAEQEEDDGDF